MTSNWPTFMGDQQRSGYCPDAFQPPLELVWNQQCSDYAQVGNYIHGSPIIIGERVYFAWDHLYALDLHTGNLVWKSQTRIDSRAKGAPLFWNDSLWVAGWKGVYQIDPHDGDLIQHWPSYIFGTSLTIADDLLYWVSVEGSLLCLDLHSHQTSVIAEDLIKTSLLTVDTNHLYGLGYRDSRQTLLAWQRKTHELVWHYSAPTSGYYLANPISVAHSRVYLPIKNGIGLVGLDSATGKLLWQSTLQEVQTTACVAQDTLYIGGYGMYALDCKTGTLLWENTTGHPSRTSFSFENSVPICIGSTIYIGGNNSFHVYAFDSKNGDLVWQYKMGSLVYSTPSYANGHLLIGSHDGYLYCFCQAQG